MFNMYFILSMYLFSSVMDGVKSSNGGEPPHITRHPKPEIAYKELEQVELPCEATGFPKPKYFWEKDGVQLNISDQNTGSLTITKPTPLLDDGVYQCFAFNGFGVAVTVKTVLRKAELHTFPSRSPQIHRPRIGDKLTLTCDPPKSYPTGGVYWGKNKAGAKLQPIDNTNRITLDYNGNLHFTNILAVDELHNHSTPYLCAVYNDVLRSVVQGADQHIEPLPGPPLLHSPELMWSSPSTETAIRGEMARMKCIFSGNPTPQVSWTRIGSSFHPKVLFQSFGQELFIPHVSVDDIGVYQCWANNSFDGPFVKKNFSLYVEAAPTWRHGRAPQDVMASEDDSVEFECIADGTPTPNVSWSFNGRPESEAQPDVRRIVFGNRVKFLQVTKADSQVLQCTASNIHGYLLANAFLFVRAEPPSVLQALPAETKVPTDKTIVLQCRMDGAPKPMIVWTRGANGLPLDDGNFRVLSNGDLEILKPSVDDSGTYNCSGRNKFGEKSVHGELIVREKTLITHPPLSQIVNVTKRVELTCKAETDPLEQSSLTVTWYKDDQLLGRSNLIGDTLVFESAQVTDSGKYKCYANSSIDSDEVSADLVVQDRPEPPTNVSIVSCLTNSVEVSWYASEDNNAPVLGYVVFYNTSYDPPGSFHVGPRVNKTEAKIRQLTPWTNYTFHVKALNSLGHSNRSAFTHGLCSTPQVKPYQNPTDVCTRNGKAGELIITWTPMRRAEHNGEGFHYVVKYQLAPEKQENREEHEEGGGKEEEEEEEVSVKVIDWSQKELIIPNQEIFRRFKISVFAVNNLGQANDRLPMAIFGHSSEGVPAISPEDFGIENGTLNSTSVVFTWNPVDTSPELINGVFLGYRVIFWKRDQPDETRMEEKILHRRPAHCSSQAKARWLRAADPVTLATHKLWGGSAIVAAAVVVNGANAGRKSNTVSFTTPEGVPDAVPILKIIEHGVHHLKLEWTHPTEINGVLSGFVIGFRVFNSSGDAMRMFFAESQRTSAKVHDLLPGTTYTIFVAAETATGRGKEKYVEGDTLPLTGPPDMPVIEELKPGDDHVLIRWLPSVDSPAQNPGSKFQVEYKEEGSPEVNTSEVEEQNNWINLTGLVEGKQYEVVVVAMNNAGRTKSTPGTFRVGPQREPVVHSAGMSNWFIGLILAILILLLILLIICILKHNKRGKYSVYEKEKRHGCNPDNSKDEPIFGEYTKSAAPPLLAANSGSINSIEKPLESETNSLAEYEDTDPTKFNEDGSFIGQYGGHKQEAALDQNAPFATIV